jgi:ribosomal-protein-alanine N-acetyltransferase
MIEIRTDRLVLKKPEDDDKGAIVEQIGDWEVAKWLSRVPHPYTAADADDWFKIIRRQGLELSVYLDTSLIGGIGLTQDEDDAYEFGYWLGRNYWGHGYATEAGAGLLRYAVDNLDSPRINSSYLQGNSASANVLRKLGFEETGKGEIYCVSRKETVPSMTLILKSFGRHQELD